MADYLDEQEQWEQVLAWLREQGPWMLATVVVVLAGFGGWRYWQAHKQRTELAAEAQYEQVIDAFGRNDFAGGTAARPTRSSRIIRQRPTPIRPTWRRRAIAVETQPAARRPRRA